MKRAILLFSLLLSIMIEIYLKLTQNTSFALIKIEFHYHVEKESKT